jgi:hypothetical protein
VSSNDESDHEPLLDVNQIASWLRVKPSWIYSHADSLGVYRVGKYLRFTKSTVLGKLSLGSRGVNAKNRQATDDGIEARCQ